MFLVPGIGFPVTFTTVTIADVTRSIVLHHTRMSSIIHSEYNESMVMR